MQGEGTYPFKFPFPKPFLLPVLKLPLLFPAQADCHDKQFSQHSNVTVGMPQHPNGCQDKFCQYAQKVHAMTHHNLPMSWQPLRSLARWVLAELVASAAGHQLPGITFANFQV